jgi:3-hydroxybutyryl-CoA dehydratase
MVDTLPEVGHVVTTTRIFDQEDFDRFALLSGDDNPIHVDEVFSARTRFGRTVAHGMLLYGVICGLLSDAFPGASQLEQHLTFPAPTYTGAELSLRAEVLAVRPDEWQAHLLTRITDVEGRVLCDGQTVLLWRQT